VSPDSSGAFAARLDSFRRTFAALEEELGRVVVGQREVVRQVLAALCMGGHVLLEGVPGLGKTLLVRTLAEALELRFSRIQFTPDLMPADLIGTTLLTEDAGGRRGFEFRAGPIFADILLADEINRATPKTQSALLEAMQERQVTVGKERHPLGDLFFVLATQNPLDMEGTYPLPEAQLDRFLLKVRVPFPGLDELDAIVQRTTGTLHGAVQNRTPATALRGMQALVREVLVADEVRRHALELVLATHPDSDLSPPALRPLIRYGASPRGAQALILFAKVLALLGGRGHVSFADVRTAVPATLRHRVYPSYEATAQGRDSDSMLTEILAARPAP
jgi:MoxR-like ATPase